MRIDANPIQLLREVFRPLPPTAEIDAPEGDEKDSVLDAIVISDMARILAEQKDEAESAELKENEAAESAEENRIDRFDSDEDNAPAAGATTTAAIGTPGKSNAPRLTFASDGDEDGEDNAFISASAQREEAAQKAEAQAETEADADAEAEAAADQDTERQPTISLEQSA